LSKAGKARKEPGKSQERPEGDICKEEPAMASRKKESMRWLKRRVVQFSLGYMLQ
jgi:hypothetical protein